MKYFFIFLLLTFTYELRAQVSVTPGSSPTQPRIDPYVYDSSFNFDKGRRKLLIGQQVYFIPYSKKYTDNKAEFSDRFIADPSEILENPHLYSRSDFNRLPEYCVYKPVLVGRQPTTYQTPLNQVLGRYFTVTGFEQNLSSLNSQDFVNLMGLSSVQNANDIFYYKLDNTCEYNRNCIKDFLVVGYYEKLKHIYINQYYYLITQNTYFRMDTLPAKDVTTGDLIPLNNNERWQCVDVTLLETVNYPKLILSLLLRNSKGATIAAGIDMPNYSYVPYRYFEILHFESFLSEKEYRQQQKLEKQKNAIKK